MVTVAITTIAEYVASLGLDAAKERTRDKLDEKKLRTELISYIERQNKYNEMCSMAEEIDFQGLIEFIQSKFLEQVSMRIFEPNRKKRGKVRQEIVEAAVVYSKANSSEGKQRVAKCIAICLDIIQDFYEEHHLSLKGYLISDIIVDALAEEVHDAQTITVAAVNSAKEQILTKIEEDGKLFSINKAVELAEAGQVITVGSGIRKVLDHISLTHPYYPDFGYDYRDSKMVSKPLTTEAQKLYPPRVTLTGAVRFGSQYYNNPNCNPLDYAYRHQLPAIMEVQKAVKLLGVKTDPIQDEVSCLVGQTVVVEPPAFPPAFACAIKVGHKTYFDYVLLRTQEIEDDGIYVIGNKDQGGAFYFEVRINPRKPHKLNKPNFKIVMTHGTNKDRLKYLQFMSSVLKENDIHIYVIAAGADLIAGNINEMELTTGFSSVDEEIDFFERICAIEDYFEVTLIPDEAISQNEYDKVIKISDLIRNDKVIGTWSEATFTGIISQNFRDELTSMDKDLYGLTYIGVSHVDLFGAKLEFRFMRTFKCARMVDYEKVKQKAEVLEDGDNIKIRFRAGNDKSIIDTLNIPVTVESIL